MAVGSRSCNDPEGSQISGIPSGCTKPVYPRPEVSTPACATLRSGKSFRPPAAVCQRARCRLVGLPFPRARPPPYDYDYDYDYDYEQEEEEEEDRLGLGESEEDVFQGAGFAAFAAQFVAGADGDQPALMHNADTIGHFLGNAELMCGKQDGHASLGPLF